MKDEFAFNHFWQRRLEGGKIVLCTENGDWIALQENDYAKVRAGEVTPGTGLFKKLEEHGIILTKNNTANVVERTRTRFGYVASGVTLHILAVTLRCNHNCIYCHAKSVPMNAKGGSDMSVQTAQRATDFAFQAPSKKFTIEFQGGEPLANFEAIQAVVERSKELSRKTGKQALFNIVSNLSLLNDEKLDYLIENNFGICTSLDGPKEVHDFNRRMLGGSSYDNAVKWIKAIKNERKYPLNALPTATRHSLSFPREIVDEYLELGFDVIRARGLNNAGVAKEAWKKIGYSPGEFLAFWKTITEYCLKLSQKGKNMREGIAALIAEKITSNKSLAYACFGAPCGAALMQAAYDSEGNVYACDEARSFEEFRIGNFKNQSYADVFTSQAALNLVDLSSGLKGMCDACAWHPYCGPCIVCTYGSQGNVIPKLAVDHECIVRKGMMDYVFGKLVQNGRDAKTIRGWIKPKREVKL